MTLSDIGLALCICKGGTCAEFTNILIIVSFTDVLPVLERMYVEEPS